MAQLVLDHFGRIGGVIIQPRRTLHDLMWSGRGRLFEIVWWMIIVAATTQPVRAGQAILVGRVGIVDGLSAFLSLLASRMLGPLIGALVGGTILHLYDRLRDRDTDRPRVTFDMAVDACAFALVPFLLLSAVGAILSNLGVPFAYLALFPNRAVTGNAEIVALRIAIGYGWSIGLFVLLFLDVHRGPGRAGDVVKEP